MPESLWADADLYDLDSATSLEDLEYWRSLVDTTRPANLLELGCGTGRLLIPMAHTAKATDPHVSVIGLDNSPALLARCAERIGFEGLTGTVAAVESDMRSFALDQRFDLIVCPLNSMAYVYGSADQLAMLRTIRAHLAPGGKFAFDLLTPRLENLAEALHGSPQHLERLVANPAPTIDLLTRHGVDRYDSDTQILRSVMTYELFHAGSASIRRVVRLDWQMVFPIELETLLSAAGLKVVERFGNYGRAPFGPDSPAYLWVVEAS